MSKIATKWKLIGGFLLFLLILSVVAKRQGWIGSPDATRVYTEKTELRDIVETVSANGKVQPEV